MQRIHLQKLLKLLHFKTIGSALAPNSSNTHIFFGCRCCCCCFCNFFWMNTSSAHVYITHTCSGYILSAPQRSAVRFSFFPRSFCVFPLNGVVAIFVVIVLVAVVAIAADSFVYRRLRLNFPHYIRLPFTITQLSLAWFVCLTFHFPMAIVYSFSLLDFICDGFVVLVFIYFLFSTPPLPLPLFLSRSLSIL